jgi:hypothetical protein
MVSFLPGNFYLENYDVLWHNDCLKRKKTPSNGHQANARLYTSNFKLNQVTGLCRFTQHTFIPIKVT